MSSSRGLGISRSQELSQPNVACIPLATQPRAFVDSDLLQYDEVWATAGTWNDGLVRLAFARHQKPVTDVEEHGVDAWVVGNI